MLNAVWFLLLAAIVSRALPLQAQSTISRDRHIKAAFLYNFGNYVQWPKQCFAGPQSPFVIGILGNNSIGTALDAVAAKKRLQDRRIVIKRFESLKEYTPCHILFVPRATDPKVQVAAIAKLRTAGVLLVGETPSFADRGGTVNFFTQQNRMRFEINQEAAKLEGLKISAKLLSLAKLVQTSKK